ncbi:CHAP domain-containing protein [Candidatus Saccharibacteria bacterium]|nr:CHAP domain-containing protein [Candidatus Saccharibacteria bacterium]
MVMLKVAKRFMIAASLVAMSAGAGVLVGFKNTNGLSRACRNSAACMEAVAREEEANAKAESAISSANWYQVKVNELSASIARKTAEIAETEANIKELEVKIANAEAELAEKQDALASLLIDMHFDGDTEPITLLAGSSSLSDLAEKQAREEVIKQEIAAAAELIKQTKAELEADKARVEELLESQQVARQELESSRAEQQNLVEKFQNDASAYTAAAEKAREERHAAEQAEQEAHPELYGGTAYYGDNTYPWQADCPDSQDYYSTYLNGHAVGGLVCECVSYTGWKVFEYYGIYAAWGNAYSWDNVARNLGYTVDNTPSEGSVGQTDSGSWGHVFWVESVNDDGSINVTEYNNAYATQLYSGDSHFGDFGARQIPASEVWRYNYIHFD